MSCSARRYRCTLFPARPVGELSAQLTERAEQALPFHSNERQNDNVKLKALSVTVCDGATSPIGRGKDKVQLITC